MIKLKPCPYCGTSVTVMRIPYGFGRFGGKYIAVCDNPTGECEMDEHAVCYDTREKAAEEWNRRNGDEH